MTEFSMASLVSCCWVLVSLKVLIHVRFSDIASWNYSNYFSDRYFIVIFCRVSILIVSPPRGSPTQLPRALLLALLKYSVIQYGQYSDPNLLFIVHIIVQLLRYQVKIVSIMFIN